MMQDKDYLITAYPQHYSMDITNDMRLIGRIFVRNVIRRVKIQKVLIILDLKSSE